MKARHGKTLEYQAHTHSFVGAIALATEVMICAGIFPLNRTDTGEVKEWDSGLTTCRPH